MSGLTGAARRQVASTALVRLTPQHESVAAELVRAVPQQELPELLDLLDRTTRSLKPVILDASAGSVDVRGRWRVGGASRAPAQPVVDMPLRLGWRDIKGRLRAACRRGAEH